jgi:hypothetical protein
VGFSGKGVPVPTEIGEPRELTFSSPTTFMRGIGHGPGSEFPKLLIEGVRRTVVVRKNMFVTAV